MLDCSNDSNSERIGNLMQARVRLRATLENFLAIQIRPTSYHGVRECNDINHSGSQVSVVFDVGANVGQSALRFTAGFPEARIYCFEPVKETFSRLRENVSRYERISCYQIGF